MPSIIKLLPSNKEMMIEIVMTIPKLIKNLFPIFELSG